MGFCEIKFDSSLKNFSVHPYLFYLDNLCPEGH